MGSAIAGRLLDAYELHVNDMNPAAADDLVAGGATFSSAAEIAAACKYIFLSLPGPAHVTGLLLGEGGLAQQLTPGTVIIDTTTGTPTVDEDLVAALSARQVDFVDAPIAGGVRRAKEGTAALMVGASDEVFARVKDLLQVVTSEVFHVGPVGTGHTMKLVNNMLNNCNRFAALEAVRLGEAGGLQRDVIIEVLNKSSGRNYATEYTFPQLLSGPTYLPQGFTIGLMRKDIHLATELAHSLGHPTPIADTVEGFAEQAIARFGADADQSQMMAEWYQD